MSHNDLNLVNPRQPKRVAIVISNPSLSTATGWPVGFWWAELAHPYLQAGLWKGFAVRDGNLLTGQQNFSGAETAQLIIETLGR